MNQNEMVLDYIRKNGSITDVEAFKKLGITRLSARIWDLRNHHNLEFYSIWQHGKNRHGKMAKWKRFALHLEDLKKYEQ